MLTDNAKEQVLDAIQTAGYQFSKGEFRNISNRRVDVSKVMQDIALAIKVLKLDDLEVREYLNEYKQAHVKTSDRVFANPNEAVFAFINDVVKQKYTVNNTFSHITTKGVVGLEVGVDDIMNELIVWRETECRDFSVGALQCALKTIMKDCKAHAACELGKQIRYDASCVEKADDAFAALYQAFDINERYDIFSTLMKHWMWCVKRKLYNLPVKWHIWLNFWGGTGIGKTTVIRKISKSVFDDLYDETTIAKLFDDTREIKRLTTKYILNMDELAVNSTGLADDGTSLKADQRSFLKAILTGDTINARVYGTQEQGKHRITFSCISSANSHLYDIIWDETSMRRFFEFNCKASTKNKQKIYKLLNEHVFPFAYEMWKSIDENRDDGYWDPESELGAEILEIQKRYYPTSSTVTAWMNANNLIVIKSPTNQPIASQYDAYKKWCIDNGFKNCKNKLNYINELLHRNQHLGTDLYFDVGGASNSEITKILKSKNINISELKTQK